MKFRKGFILLVILAGFASPLLELDCISNSVSLKDVVSHQTLSKINIEMQTSKYIGNDSTLALNALSGSGESNNPYIIGNWHLETSMNGIIIENTTKHFILCNCTLEGSLITSEKFIGIKVQKIADNTCIIYNNTCSRFYNGIEIIYTNKISLIQNFCYNNSNAGIRLTNVRDSKLIGNLCKLNSKDGFYFWYSTNPIYYYNNATLNGNSGLFLYGCAQARIYNNSFIANNKIGVYLFGIYLCTIYLNDIKYNTQYGIQIITDCHNAFYLNNFVKNGYCFSQSQAYDSGEDNIWFNIASKKGNYWSDWINGSYLVDGISHSRDSHPLNASLDIFSKKIDIKLDFSPTTNTTQLKETESFSSLILNLSIFCLAVSYYLIRKSK